MDGAMQETTGKSDDAEAPMEKSAPNRGMNSSV